MVEGNAVSSCGGGLDGTVGKKFNWIIHVYSSPRPGHTFSPLENVSMSYMCLLPTL
jgi:hypothetical protein